MSFLEPYLKTLESPYCDRNILIWFNLKRISNARSNVSKLQSWTIVGEQKFGQTFSYWNPAPFMLGDHAGIFFGQDRKGNEYFFSKNGAKGPLVIMPNHELKKIYSLFNVFKTNYRKK